MQRLLLILGAVLLILGLLWPWLSRSPWWRWIGRLPGDIRIQRDGFSFFFPITTSIVVSVAVMVVLWMIRR